MWLINTKTWELEEIINPQKGSYAILSHTWEDGEVSFQQYKELRKAAEMTEFDEILKKLGEMKGLHKVLKTVEMARTGGLEYAWVDTCCIDKSSSAELSEAINSMFKWYEDAAVCFAYLSDLPTIEHICTSTQANSDDKKQIQKELFRHCYWFSRGWTLQELIAPETVEFYDSEWKCYGTKAMLKETISSITKIPKHVLDKFIPLQTVTIAQRMSWAADRSTTRVEDMAYCLMGLFDLNMTLLYGEGHKAFIRLQEEICKESTDLSLFAWRSESRVDVSTPSQKYRGVLASSPSEFRGCNNIYSTSNSKRHKGEFQITNGGLRLDDCSTTQSLYISCSYGYSL
ncbi:heterokaryon incompatibility protein-domain-containing protein [Xylariaceae sp. AK1471]|nr:heterokaryon incompatibility protein-domain-containing protein [Xylariaceae sp. AK1471]